MRQALRKLMRNGQDADGSFTLARHPSMFVASAIVDGDLTGFYVRPDQRIQGEIDYSSGRITLSGDVSAVGPDGDLAPFQVQFHVEFEFSPPSYYAGVDFDVDLASDVLIPHFDTPVDGIAWYDGNVVREFGRLKDDKLLGYDLQLDLSTVESDRVTMLVTRQGDVHVRVVCLEESDSQTECLALDTLPPDED